MNGNGIYYFDDNSVLKYLRKVLAEINPGYVDCGIRSAFLLKRYIERYKVFDNPKKGPRLALLTMLKDIGTYYKSNRIPRSNPALAAASSYAFMHNCSPFNEDAKPLLFYQSKYLSDTNDPDHEAGLLMSLVNQIIEYNYQEYTIDEMYELIRKDKRGIFNPEQVKKMFKLLKEQPDIYQKLNDKNSLFIYEASKYISTADYSVEELIGFIDMATFAFEFHNDETLAHTVTVASIAEELARLSKLPEPMIIEIRLASLVHDIGKIRVPIEILSYPGKLSDAQFAEMKKHVEYTRDIITGCFSFKIVDIASHHHEKLDGSGYPEHLRERDLSIGDKIIAVADITSALYCKRSYKGSFADDKIQEILKSNCDKGQIDKRICQHLFDNWDHIMEVTKAVETDVLNQYGAMKGEFAALSKSKVLYQLFDYEDTYRSIFDKDDPEENSEVIQYIDEDGNPLTPEEAAAIEEANKQYKEEAAALEAEEQAEEVIEAALDEETELEEEVIESEDTELEAQEIEENSEDELEAIEDTESEELEEAEEVIESEDSESDNIELAEENTESIEDEFAAFADAIPEKEENNNSDDEFEAFLNSVPEKEEKNESIEDEFAAFANAIPEKEESNKSENIESDDLELVDLDEEETESVEDEFEAFLNSVPEKEEPSKEAESEVIVEEEPKKTNAKLNSYEEDDEEDDEDDEDWDDDDEDDDEDWDDDEDDDDDEDWDDDDDEEED